MAIQTHSKGEATVIGCEHCEYDSDSRDAQESKPLGYVILDAFDEVGHYTYLGRCYYCNHSRR